MVSRGTRIGTATVAVISTLALSGCGDSTLSASSSCQDFMKASASEQHEVVDQLSSQYEKAAYATPLGEPEVPYYCSANPSVTLGQFFQKAEE
jgi:hypothetical protein